jgi:hypothetical protein
MRNYIDFLGELEELKNEPVTAYRKATFLYWKTLISSYDFSLKYQKLKHKSVKKINFQEDYNKNLSDFFGSNDMNDQEKKLKMLRKKLKEINTLN